MPVRDSLHQYDKVSVRIGKGSITALKDMGESIDAEATYPSFYTVIPRKSPMFSITIGTDILRDVLEGVKGPVRFDFYDKDSPFEAFAEIDGKQVYSVAMPIDSNVHDWRPQALLHTPTNADTEPSRYEPPAVLNKQTGFGWKFLNSRHATEWGENETVYPVPKYCQKWGDWFQHPQPRKRDNEAV